MLVVTGPWICGIEPAHKDRGLRVVGEISPLHSEPLDYIFVSYSTAPCSAKLRSVPQFRLLKYKRHKVSCLCGTVQVCSGDICGRTSDYGLDDDILVQLSLRPQDRIFEGV